MTSSSYNKSEIFFAIHSLCLLHHVLCLQANDWTLLSYGLLHGYSQWHCCSTHSHLVSHLIAMRLQPFYQWLLHLTHASHDSLLLQCSNDILYKVPSSGLSNHSVLLCAFIM